MKILVKITIISLSCTLYFFSVGEIISSTVPISGPFCYCKDPARANIFDPSPYPNPCDTTTTICNHTCGFSYYDFNKAFAFEDSFRTWYTSEHNSLQFFKTNSNTF